MYWSINHTIPLDDLQATHEILNSKSYKTIKTSFIYLYKQYRNTIRIVLTKDNGEINESIRCLNKNKHLRKAL